jgi:hypothetical protein
VRRNNNINAVNFNAEQRRYSSWRLRKERHVMKSTSILSVCTDLYLIDDIVIHPNAGYDLGLISPVTSVKIFSNIPVEEFNGRTSGFCAGNIILKNQCKNGTIMLGKKFWKKLGTPNNVKLHFDQDKILISNY